MRSCRHLSESCWFKLTGSHVNFLQKLMDTHFDYTYGTGYTGYSNAVQKGNEWCHRVISDCALSTYRGISYHMSEIMLSTEHVFLLLLPAT
jgi:hypothetical protein